MHIIRLAALLLPATACLAQDIIRMDQIVESYASANHFMGSVLLARGSDVLFSKGYGFAELEWKIPNSPQARYRIGSITKQFTAACILLLEERGKLNTGDPVKKYMPDAPAAWDRITIFHLLTHTSGIPNFTEFPEYHSIERFPATPEKLVSLFRNKSLEFQPGEKWSYSNSGYVLLGYILEKVTGQSYAQFLQENILTPLGMLDTGYDSNTAIIPRRAYGYTSGPSGPANAGYIDMSVPFAAGGLYSTPPNLLIWEQGLFGGKILSEASLKKMITPDKNDYACGLEVREPNGRKVIEHGGGIEGFNAMLAYYPADKLTVAVLGNLNGSAPGEIALKLAAVAHGEKVELPSERSQITLPRETLALYVGTYQLLGTKMLITLEGDQLMAKLGLQPSLPIYAESETKFFYKVVDAQIDFEKNDQGVVTALVLHQNGRDRKAPRISSTVELPPERKSVTLSPGILKEFVGTYRLAPGVDIAITLESDQLMLQVTGQPKFSLYAETETRFFLKAVDAQIDFVKGSNGVVTSLILHQNGQDHKAERQ